MSEKPPATALTQAVTSQLQQLIQGPPSQANLTQAYRLLAKWRGQLVANTIVQRQGTVVAHGPFQGLDYATEATEGARSARLLGGYEASLAPLIDWIIATGYEQVIDIGSAEGYYAVGLAMRMPGAQVLACDINPAAQAACRALAERNGVADRVAVAGEWTHSDFALCQEGKTVVICDIEGAEDDLLDPAKAPGLMQADILVEVHDCFAPGLSDKITKRFEQTHEVTRFDRQLSSAALPDWMEAFSDLDRLTALWEWRAGPTPWLWIQRRDG